jgi:hypothetical protein
VKIKLSELRSLIRSSVISEAPLAGIEPAGEEDWTVNAKSDYVLQTKNHSSDADVEKDRKEVKKFFDNKNFYNSAIKLYKNLSVPIYVVPAFTWWASNRGRTSDRTRERYSDASILARFGVPSNRILQLEEARKQGAAILVPLVEHLQKGFLSTPWMIIHAMIDETSNISVMGKYMKVINKMFIDAFKNEKNEYMNDYFKFYFWPKIVSALTMKSAVTNAFRNYNWVDVISEIVTQAILDTRGFHYNETGDPKLDELLSNVKNIVSTARKDFEDAIRGKVIVIEAHIKDRSDWNR